MEKHVLFARLLESLLLEASTGIDLVKRNPGGTELMRAVHQETPLPADAAWEVVKKVEWSSIKGKGWRGTGGGWIIVLGRQGTGAIFANTHGEYEVFASNGKPGSTGDDGKPNRLMNASASSGGEAVRMIKEVTGPVTGYAVAKLSRDDSKDIQKKREKRAAINKAMAPMTVSRVTDITSGQAMADKLLLRFKPLWIKAMVQAIADIKGFLGLQIKNDAYGKVNKRLRRLETLDGWLRNMQDGGDIAETGLRNLILHAVDLAALHHYPDEVPDHFTLTYNRGLDNRLPDGYAKLLNGIANGDTRLLTTVLYFFKKGMLSK